MKRRIDDLNREERATLAAPLLDPRYEMIPLKGAVSQSEHLPEGATITVTASPTKGMEATVDLTVELSKRGFEVIPHLSARSTKDHAELEWILDRLATAGISEAFVVAGDSVDPGVFPDGLSLLTAMAAVGHGFEAIGVPGYPDGHPFIPNELLQEALQEKVKFASWITTQMCFDPAAVQGWTRNQRRLGIELPVYIGVPGVAELRKLIGISARIGVGESTRFLSANRGLVGRMARPGGYAPVELLLSLAPLLSDEAANIAGFHIYTFNQLETTERWRRGFIEELTD